jgi:GTP-binding protein
MFVALNKEDLTEAQENSPELREWLEDQGYRVFEISAATGQGVPALLEAVSAKLEEIRQETPPPGPKPQEQRLYSLAEADERAWTVEQLADGHFRVSGIAIDRLTRMTNFDQPDAITRFQRVLVASGISQELERLGVTAGDVVTIAGFDLTWGEEHELEEPGPVRRTARLRRYGTDAGDEFEDENQELPE